MINTVDDIPRSWRNALALLRTAIPAAVMAGGCLRDRDNGRPVKDIDIFVPVSTSKHEDLEAIKKIVEGFGWMDVNIDNAKMYPEGCDTRVVGIVDCRVPNAPPIQIIVGEWDTDNLFRHFDFGICQISFDGKSIRRSHHYNTDRVWQRFRIVTERSDKAFVSSINRWARLKQKYEGWTFDLGTRGSGAVNG